MTQDAESLTLKWGTLKGWHVVTDKSVTALEKYASFGMALGTMQQRDSSEQKQALCELIEAIDGEIVNDWTGEQMTKDEAKKYVMEYGA